MPFASAASYTVRPCSVSSTSVLRRSAAFCVRASSPRVWQRRSMAEAEGVSESESELSPADTLPIDPPPAPVKRRARKLLRSR